MLDYSVKDLYLQGGRRRPTVALCERPHYGIELEYERGDRLRVPETLGRKWSLKPDGSLRNHGIEIVSVPLLERTVINSVKSILGVAREAGVNPHARCGLHVHTNMLPYNVGQLGSYTALYTLMEPSLFAEFCPHRRASAFCVPFAEYHNGVRQVAQLIGAARQKEPKLNSRGISGLNKYAALNLRTLMTFGTVENRQLFSTLDDELAAVWIQGQINLRRISVEYKDPLRLLDDYENLGLEHFQRAVIGNTVRVNSDDQDMAYISAMIMAEGEAPPAARERLRQRTLHEEIERLVMEEAVRGEEVEIAVWQPEEEDLDIREVEGAN